MSKHEIIDYHNTSVINRKIRNLTPKQEKFVIGLINGLTQRQAYKYAYDAENMKDSTIDSKACELFRRDNIQTRYKQLIEKRQKAVIENISNINSELILKIEKYKNENETIVEFIENAILKSLPKEMLSQDELKALNRRRHINDNTRYAVLERAGFKCQCCGEKPGKENNITLHIDHIIPFSMGGKDTIDNLQVLCNKCNASKGNRFIVNHNKDWLKKA